MKIKLHFKLLLVFVAFLVSSFAYSQTLYNVVLGTDNVKITELQLTFNGIVITETNGIGSGGKEVPLQEMKLRYLL